ncbi:dihydropteroate synthase [Uliginosibacterium sp. H3]|uniref:dihydropteroate synthase n=1 Tax=Uliginosibacterium silvisoli TaxID=3114758 RepID=A0ABU6K647_9RHOO|nr:dihydropteroate synthase [Uliginosibacterium sp. H3]
MAIINVTPDSFSGDGLVGRRDMALRQAEQAIADGADILDIGGESSRPGAEAVGLQEELDRVVPIVEAFANAGVPLSVDTVKPQVMRAVASAGAAIINDINGLREPGAIEAVAATDVGVCLMHMQGEPRTMQSAPHYRDVVTEVRDFLCLRADALKSAGVATERILVDPGFGFGKALVHNLALFADLSRLRDLGYPLLIGVSRKSMLGQITGQPVAQRLAASVAAAMLAVQRGAAIVRVHDVAATRDAFAIMAAIQSHQQNS